MFTVQSLEEARTKLKLKVGYWFILLPESTSTFAVMSHMSAIVTWNDSSSTSHIRPSGLFPIRINL
jgi:hypothetical protein